MGWSSAGSKIFDPVTRALIDAGADSATKQRVLGDLIAELQRQDWDTEDESLEEFAHDPAVVAAFADHGVRFPDATITVLAQDADAVRQFAEHRAELRAARTRGTRLCGETPCDTDLAWLTCTHDLNADGDHDGEHSWYRDRA